MGVAGSLLPTMETWIEILDPGFSLVNQQLEDLRLSLSLSAFQISRGNKSCLLKRNVSVGESFQLRYRTASRPTGKRRGRCRAWPWKLPLGMLASYIRTLLPIQLFADALGRQQTMANVLGLCHLPRSGVSSLLLYCRHLGNEPDCTSLSVLLCLTNKPLKGGVGGGV